MTIKVNIAFNVRYINKYLVILLANRNRETDILAILSSCQKHFIK